MVRVASSELLAELSNKPLANLARNLGINVDDWLPVASSPLPITLRISPNRHDSEWTKERLRKMGGEKLYWMDSQDNWILPFSKDNFPNAQVKKEIMLLHQTGKITRQEAVSMLPPIILEPNKDDIVMDTCAAPGSKATQLAELVNEGAVIANEPSAGRLNLLVTNRGRLGLHNILIMQHDGRHIGRIPEPGLDGIIVDAPCTGSATTRKNRDLWWNWTPKAGRSLFKLQVDISKRAAGLLRPGGRLVYSTCSLDPTENEAVVCEIIRSCPWLELINIDTDRLFPGLKVHRGISDWSILNEEGEVVEFEGVLPKLPGISEDMLNPNQRGEEAPNLSNTIRIHQHDNDTGGFFVALFKHVEERTPEGVAKSMILKRPLEREAVILPEKKQNRHTTTIANDEIISEICSKWGISKDNFSWWHRGKRINLCPNIIVNKLYEPMVRNKKGDFWPSNSFHPLKVIHVGQPSFTENRGVWRPRYESLELLRKHISKGIIDVSLSSIIDLIKGNSPLIEEFECQLPEGSVLLRNQDYLIPVWVAARVSLMINNDAQEIIKIKLGISED